MTNYQEIQSALKTLASHGIELDWQCGVALVDNYGELVAFGTPAEIARLTTKLAEMKH